MPDSVHAAVLARTDQLGETERFLLQVCSVIGDAPSAAFLGQVSEIDEPTLDAALVGLQEGQFLRRSHLSLQVRYRFFHAIIEDVVYSSLSRQRRAELHAKVARLLELDRFGILDKSPEIIARHLEGAGNFQAAIPYWCRAARQAYERSANVEAIRFAQKGLDLIAAEGPDAMLPDEELNLLLTLAPALVAVRGYGTEELGPHYDHATRLCERVGNPNQLFRTLIGRWNYHWVRGELDQAGRLLLRARLSGGPGYALRAHAAMGEVLFHRGEIEAADSHLSMALSTEPGKAGTPRSVEIGRVACLCYAAWSAWHLGRESNALHHAQEALRLAGALNHPLSSAVSAALIAELHQFRGAIDNCEEAADRAIAISTQQQFPFWQGTAMVMSGWAKGMACDFETGERLVLEGIHVFSSTGARIQVPTWVGMLAEVQLKAGRSDQAMTSVDKALSLAEKTDERHYLSELRRIRGDILVSQGAVGRNAAEIEYIRAVEIALAQGAYARGTRAQTALRRLRAQPGS